MDNNIKEIQSELLVLLKRFHLICTENDIRYSLHGGTLLGAVREHGFIPWDDDVDISFSRSEYEKFKKVIREILKSNDDEEYSFNEFDNAFPQLWMSREGHPAVWLDFFVYDYISNNALAQKIKIFNLSIMLGLLKNKETMKLTKERGTYKHLKYFFIYFLYLIGKLIPVKAKNKLAEKVRKSFPGKRQLVHRANDRYIGLVLILPVETIQEYELVDFEDTRLMVFKDNEKVLVSSYGEDYMIPKQFSGGDETVHSYAREQKTKRG